MEGAPDPVTLRRNRLTLLAIGGLILAFVGGFVVLQTLVGSTMMGPVSLAVEPADKLSYTAVGLDENETREKAPLLAALLDEAAANGTARSDEGPGAEQALTYLEARAYAVGVKNFQSAPINGQVNWKGSTYNVMYLRG